MIRGRCAPCPLSPDSLPDPRRSQVEPCGARSECWCVVAGMGGSLLLINGLLVPVPSILLLAQEGLCAAISLAIFFFLLSDFQFLFPVA